MVCGRQCQQRFYLSWSTPGKTKAAYGCARCAAGDRWVASAAAGGRRAGLRRW